jgi:hypothetical protein
MKRQMPALNNNLLSEALLFGHEAKEAVDDPPPTPGLWREGSRWDEKGNPCYGVGQVGKWNFPPGLVVRHWIDLSKRG